MRARDSSSPYRHGEAAARPGEGGWRQQLPTDPDLAPDDPAEPSLTHHPIHHVPRSRQLNVLGSIGMGGFVGTLARYGVGMWWQSRPGHFSWGTFTINTTGAFLLGLFLPRLLPLAGAPRYLRTFFCVGLLGAWTTMSSFAVETDLLVKGGKVGSAMLYVVATVFAGLAVAWLGVAIARVRLPRGFRWRSH